MEIKGVYKTEGNNQPDSTMSSSNIPLSAQQLRDEVSNAIALLKARGIEDWQILSIWSEIACEQGNYVTADTLASAAIELGKPIE